MPAAKRRALVSPDPRPPHPAKVGAYSKLSLRPSLRNYRDDAVASSESDSDGVDTDVELGPSLSALEDQLDAQEDDSGSDVESSLVLNVGDDVHGVKGKGVDPREYGPSYRKRMRERAPYRRALERRQPKRARRNPRARVVSTESINAITKCIDGLATSPSDSDDEQFVSSTLAQDPGIPTSPIYAPRSPSPAPPSSSCDSDDGYEPESPLAEKSRVTALTRRRLDLLKRKAKLQHGKQKRWHLSSDTSPRSEELIDLAAWASSAGYKLVPKSPVQVRDIGDRPPVSVRTVLFPDDAGHADTIKRPTTPTTPETSGVHSRTSTHKRHADAQVPLAEAWEGDVILATASEDEVDPPSPTPPPRKRARAQPATSPDVRTRPNKPVPRRLDPVPRRHTHRAAPQRVPSRDTSNLHRSSPTSLLPRREKHVRFFGSRSERRKDSEERRRQRGVFGWGQFVNDERAVNGATHAAVLRGVKVAQRVRASLLRRFGQREQQTLQSLPAWRASPSGHLGVTRLHRRRASYSDDEAVEALLPDDVEMRDDDAVDAALGDAANLILPQIAGRKRASQCPETHVHSRQQSAAWSHAGTITSYLVSRRAYNLSRVEEKRVAAEQSRQRRAALTAHILASQAAEAEAIAAAQAAQIASVNAECTRTQEESQVPDAEEAAAAEVEAEVDTAPMPEPTAPAPASTHSTTDSLFNATQRQNEARARSRRENVARHRAADRVEHARPHTSRPRLVDRPSTRIRRPPRPAASSTQPEAPACERAARAARAVSAQPEAMAHVSPRRRALSVDTERPAQVPAPAPAAVTPQQPQIPTSSPSIPEDEPPRYEFPFFPVAQVGQRTTARRGRPRAQSESIASLSTPPRYMPSTYSRRSPSPPPPYNAQSAGETQTLVPPVFLLDGGRPGADWPQRSPGVPIDQRRQEMGRSMGVPGWYEDEVEEVIFEDVPPGPVRRWYDEGEEEMSVAEERERAREESAEGSGSGTFGTIGRWLGLW